MSIRVNSKTPIVSLVLDTICSLALIRHRFILSLYILIQYASHNKIIDSNQHVLVTDCLVESFGNQAREALRGAGVTRYTGVEISPF